MIRLLLNVFSACGYLLLHEVNYNFPKILNVCSNINNQLRKTIDEIALTMNDNGFPVIIQKEHSTGIICNEEDGHYGYMLIDDKNHTNIYINNKILYLPNTLYNVVLHEILHAIGLNHNKGEYGIMNYAITENWFGYPINDNRKLWLSIDDLRGLYDIKYVKGLITKK